MDDLSEDQLIDLTRQVLVGWDQADVTLELIQKGGSDRHYFRVTASGKFRGPSTVILMVYTDRRPDNLSFFAATQVLATQGVRTPRVYFHEPQRRLAWLEDLGRTDLWEFRDAPAEVRLPLYRDALEQLAQIHVLRPEKVRPELARQLQPPFEESLYLWEQNYFFDNFALNFSSLSAEEIGSIRQGAEFREMAAALAEMPRFLVHRDFQSQNILIREGRTWFIDYQGLRGGRPEYDLASLLYDPYVRLTAEEREDLAAHYFEVRPHDDQWDTNPEILAACICQRLMQALGAYGFLGIQRNKPAFLAHIPQAVENLRSVLAEREVFPGLLDVLQLRETESEPLMLA